MRLLVFEFVTGGGFYGKPIPLSLQQEGDLMLRALLQDCLDCRLENSLEILTLRDPRLKPLDLPIEVMLPQSIHAVQSCWESALKWAEAVCIIAPESHQVLAQFSEQVLNQGRILLGSHPAAVRLTASKMATAAHLAAHHIPVAATHALTEALPISEYGWVIKHDDGAGCEQTYWCADAATIKQRQYQYTQPVVQPYFPGEAVSLSLLCNQTACRLVAVNRQFVTLQNGVFRYHGSEVNALADNAASFAPLAAQIHAAIPGLWGWVGVDAVLTGQQVIVLEINPRITTSYIGLRTSLNYNPADLLFALLEDNMSAMYVPLSANPITVRLPEQESHHVY